MIKGLLRFLDTGGFSSLFQLLDKYDFQKVSTAKIANPFLQEIPLRRTPAQTGLFTFALARFQADFHF